MPETQVESGAGDRRPEDRGDILSRIVATKRVEIARLAPRRVALRASAESAPPPRDFRGALSRPGSVSLIAEVKRRSPGAGEIRPTLDPVGLAESYAHAGASAISVLTDGDYFGGALEDLETVRSAVTIPVLRKDFVLDPLQLWEARSAGADAVLLIVRILEDSALRDLRLLAEDLGMTALVEVHDAEELDRALRAGGEVLGINNRDLRSFETRLETTLELLPLVPDSAVLVSESGVRTVSDVERLGGAGVDAVLVGEALLRAEVPGDLAADLSRIPAVDRGGWGVDETR
ncbi:MAG: indole-3-glycerol phosphate synthase TrpC [Gemmatimonadota bacterium]